MNTKSTTKNLRKKSDTWRMAIEALRKCGIAKYCVLYLKAGDRVEYKSPWFYSRSRCQQARDILKAKGYQAVIFVD